MADSRSDGWRSYDSLQGYRNIGLGFFSPFEPKEIICAACKRSCETDNRVALNTLPQSLLDLEEMLLV
jgi:hypothetical protein